MILYLLKSTVCLGSLLAFYYLFLEKEKMHQFNRMYLLGSTFFSFMVPLFIIYSAPVFVQPANIDLQTATSSNSNGTAISILSNVIENLSNYSLYLFGSYLLTASLLVVRIAKNLDDIFQKIKSHKNIKHQSATVVLLSEKVLPHTFLNYIFINKEEYELNKIEEELFTHELAHAEQKHTFDILFIEFLQAVFWFNPFLILLKKAIRLNHEFLADQAAITSHKNIAGYQQLLLSKTAWNCKSYLASQLNFSLTKKRFIMMTKSKSNSRNLWKKLTLLPLLALLVFLFANKITAQKGATPEMLTEFNTLTKQLEENGTETFGPKKLKRVEYIYSQMSEHQKKSANPFPMALDTDKGHDEKTHIDEKKKEESHAVNEQGDEHKEGAENHGKEAKEGKEHHEKEHAGEHQEKEEHNGEHKEGGENHGKADKDKGHDEKKHTDGKKKGKEHKGNEHQ